MKPVFLSPEDVGVKHSTRFHRVAYLLDPIFLLDRDGLLWITPESTPQQPWSYDGASIPWLVRPIVGDPFDGDFVRMGAAHDRPYQTGRRMTIPQSILDAVDIRTVPWRVLVTLPRIEVPTTRPQVDRSCCLDALIADDAEPWRQRAVYRGVRLGGWRAWGNHERRRAAAFASELAAYWPGVVAA